MFILFSFILGLLAVMLDILLGMASENMQVGLFYALFSLVPFIGGLWLLILTLTDGQPAANRYGENPKLAV